MGGARAHPPVNRTQSPFPDTEKSVFVYIAVPVNTPSKTRDHLRDPHWGQHTKPVPCLRKLSRSRTSFLRTKQNEALPINPSAAQQLAAKRDAAQQIK